MEQKTLGQKLGNFIKRYAYFLLMILLVVSFITITIIVSLTSETNNNTSPTNSDITLTTYHLPVLEATVYKEYNSTNLMYNKTLEQWEAHKCVDLKATKGSSVYSIADGVVQDVYTNYLDGTVIVIGHKNNLISKYASLNEDVNVSVGDNVVKGQIIGTVDETANASLDAGAHIQFTLFENDTKINPASYLDLGTK